MRTRNKTLSDENTASIYKHIAHHLQSIKREFDEGLEESVVENFDETHMVIDMDNGHVLDFQFSKHVTCADLASARYCFTVCMRLSGGPQGKIEKPLVIFQNPSSKYPIAGIPDNIQGITYRSSPKGWMSSQLFHEYFSNEQVIAPLDGGRARKLWIDSCRVHNNTPELLEPLQSCQTDIRRFHPNCTSLVQPLDQMLIRSFKFEWRKRWARLETS